jgi:hypothetical protein
MHVKLLIRVLIKSKIKNTSVTLNAAFFGLIGGIS